MSWHRRLGLNQEGLETSSNRTSVTTTRAPHAGVANGDEDFFFKKKTGGTNFGQQKQARLGARRDEGPIPPGGDLAALLRDLGGPVA
jgi:hypothetical protein